MIDPDYALRYMLFPALELGLDAVRAIVTSGGCDGIILDHTRLQDERVRYLMEQDDPFVTFGRSELIFEHTYFDLDNEDIAVQGASKLIGLGCRRLALMNADPEQVFSRQWLAGFRRALAKAGLPSDVGDDFIRTHFRDLARAVAPDHPFIAVCRAHHGVGRLFRQQGRHLPASCARTGGGVVGGTFADAN